mgnify:FL=1
MSTSTEQPKVRNKYAMASVVFGIVAMLLLLLGGGGNVAATVGLIVGLVAIGTGVLGYRASQELEKKKGRLWAMAGIAIGAIALLVAIVQFVS